MNNPQYSTLKDENKNKISAILPGTAMRLFPMDLRILQARSKACRILPAAEKRGRNDNLSFYDYHFMIKMYICIIKHR